MGVYTTCTRHWLDRRFRNTTPDGVYLAHMPIYGVGHAASEPGHLPRLARALQILRTLDGLEFTSFLDVGGAEGYLAHLVRTRFGADVQTCDLSVEACRRARELFAVPSVAFDGVRLPFPDDAFDVVLCSEVLEHVEFAVELVLELGRVARHAVVVTTEECSTDRDEIREELARRCGFPHHERNFFHPDDLELLLDGPVELRSQFRRALREVGDAAEPRAALLANAPATLDPDAIGVVCLRTKTPTARRADRRHGDDALLGLLLGDAARVPPSPLSERDGAATPAARALRCPRTHAPLAPSPDGSGRLLGDDTAYDVIGGVPVVRDDELADPTRAELATALAATRSPADVEAVLALRDELVLPAATSLDWQFASDAAAGRGWLTANSLDARADARHPLCLTAADADPWLISPTLGRNGDELGRLRLRMRLHNPDYPRDAGVGQVFWLAEDELDFGEDRCVTFAVLNDGDLHDYEVALADHPAWPRDRQIVCLRIDPVDGPCALDVDSITLG